MGDFYGAKQFYLEALTKTVTVNHRIRKDTLLRLWSINKKIGFTEASPEKILLSRYYISKKIVQFVLDQSSFINTKVLRSTMFLAKMLFESLSDQDEFGFTILKNGYQPDSVPDGNEKDGLT